MFSLNLAFNFFIINYLILKFKKISKKIKYNFNNSRFKIYIIYF